MQNIQELYKEHVPKSILKDYLIISPLTIFVISLFMYSDTYLLKFPEFVYMRIPVLIVMVLQLVFRLSFFSNKLYLVNYTGILSVVSLIVMGVGIAIMAKEDEAIYQSCLSGLIVDIFVSYFLVRGRRNIIIAYIITLIISVAIIAIFMQPSFMEARSFLNAVAMLIAVIAMSLTIEGTRHREFTFKHNLKFEKEKSEDLYHETLTQNKELQQQKEEIMVINDKLEQQTEELQVNLEVISELNGVLRKKNKAITDSINYARRIQEAILPSRDYISKLFSDSFILFKPCDIVSGDFYWFKETPQYKIVAAVDCTGHGIPGAFMSMLGYSLLNEITEYGTITNANEILNQLKVKLKESLNQSDEVGALSDGLDIALCMIETNNKKLQFAGAYMPLCIVRDNEVIGIKGDKMPIGRYIKEIDSFTNHIVEIKENDVFYLYSDGYQDQIGGKEKKRFLSHNFRNLLLDIHKEPFNKQKEILDNTIDEWSKGVGQVDDILVVGFQV